MREEWIRYGVFLVCMVMVWGCAFHAPEEDWAGATLTPF